MQLVYGLKSDLLQLYKPAHWIYEVYHLVCWSRSVRQQAWSHSMNQTAVQQLRYHSRAEVVRL